MKKPIKVVIKALCLPLMFLSSFSALSADLEQGIFQLNRGEFKAAIAEFSPLVNEGFAPAQYQMALINLNGWGVQKNPNKAVELFTLAANQNYPDAQFELSLIYSEGKHVKKDLKKAFELTSQAAKKDLPSALFNLGVMYYNGTGTHRDFSKAAKNYEKAAQLNYALAQFNLALMFDEGKGVQKSTMKSYIWNIIAAKNGYVQAEKSRDLDERNLSIKDIEKGRNEAEVIYNNIVARAEMRAKKDNEKLTF